MIELISISTVGPCNQYIGRHYALSIEEKHITIKDSLPLAFHGRLLPLQFKI